MVYWASVQRLLRHLAPPADQERAYQRKIAQSPFRRSGESTLPPLYLCEQFERPFNFQSDLADILAVHCLIADMPQIAEWREDVSNQGQW
jgi:hypothetical protein